MLKLKVTLDGNASPNLQSNVRRRKRDYLIRGTEKKKILVNAINNTARMERNISFLWDGLMSPWLTIQKESLKTTFL